MTYKDININKWLQLQSVLSETDDLSIQAKLIAIVNDMTEEEVLNKKLSEYSKLVHSIDFLLEKPVVSKKAPKKIILNGRKYDVVTDMRNLTAGQYIDYNSLVQMNENDKYLPNILACFIVPEGENYGDYDVMAVADEIGEYLDVETAMGLLSFFQNWFRLFVLTILKSSEKTIKRMIQQEKDETKKKEMKETLLKLKEYRHFIKSGNTYTSLI